MRCDCALSAYAAPPPPPHPGLIPFRIPSTPALRQRELQAEVGAKGLSTETIRHGARLIYSASPMNSATDAWVADQSLMVTPLQTTSPPRLSTGGCGGHPPTDYPCRHGALPHCPSPAGRSPNQTRGLCDISRQQPALRHSASVGRGQIAEDILHPQLDVGTIRCQATRGGGGRPTP